MKFQNRQNDKCQSPDQQLSRVGETGRRDGCKGAQGKFEGRRVMEMSYIVIVVMVT